MALSLKLSPRSTLKFKTQVKIPARLLGGDGIDVAFSNGAYTISVDPDLSGIGISPFWQTVLDELTQAASFDALAPTTTRGDIIFRNATTNTRLPAGTAGYALMATGTDPAWTGFTRSGSGITRTWQAKAADVFSLKDYGAVGDGVTDDTAAILAWATAINTLGAAVATAVRAHVPAGSYILNRSAPIGLTAKHLHIEGDGAWQTSITNIFPGNTGVFDISSTVFNDNHTLIEKLRVCTNDANASAIGIQLTRRAGTVIRYVSFDTTKRGLYINTESFAVAVEVCYFVGLTGFAISSAVGRAANHLRITGSRFFGNGIATSTPAIAISDALGVFVGHNNIEGNYGGGQFGDTYGLTFAYNYVENPAAGTPLYFNAPNYSTWVIGNIFGPSAAMTWENLNGGGAYGTHFDSASLSFGATALGFTMGDYTATGTSVIGNPPAHNLFGTAGGDLTVNASNLATLATVNANVGTFGSATQSPQVTVNGKGQVTGAANVTVTPAVGSITGLGANVPTALGVAVGTDGAFVVKGGALGSPSSAGTMPAFTLGGTVTSNGQSFSGTIANLGTVTTVDINGGTIDGAVIGGASAAAGTFTTIDLGHASDTTLSRSAAGQIQVEGVDVATASNTLTLTGKTIASASNTLTIGAAWSSFHAHKNGTNQTGIASDTWTQVTFGTEVYDTGNNFASNVWTPPAGKVKMIASVNCFAGSAINGFVVVSIYKNGSSWKVNSDQAFMVNQSKTVTVTADDNANGTDVYTVYAFITSGSTSSLSGNAAYSYFCGSMIQ